MALSFDPIIRPFAVPTPSMRKRKLESLEAALERAEFRLKVAEFASQVAGGPAVMRAAVKAAVEAKLIEGGRAPGRETIRKLVKRYADGQRSASDYRDDLTPRGPKPAPVIEEVVAIVRLKAQRHGVNNISHLTRLVNDEVKKRQLRGEELTPWSVRRILQDVGLHTIIAGRQGSRAAELDAFQRGTYPTLHTHDLWLLDEGDTQHWARGFCPVTEQWVPVRPNVVLARDHKSGAIVSALVVDPTRRIDDAANTCFRTGFDSSDVLGAILSAAVPDLAHPDMRELAGALPKKLKWDNASQHLLLERTLFGPKRIERETRDIADPDAGEVLEGDGPLLATERIAVRRPDRNGAVERMMPVMKQWLIGRDIRGHVDEVIPVEVLQPGDDLARARAALAAAGERPSRLTPVFVTDLPTIAQLQEALDAVVLQYNTQHRLRRHGLTPLGAARKYMPKAPRRGEDLVRALGAQSYTVGGEGIVVQRDGHSAAFRAINNGVILQLGSTVQAYVDPLLRRVWLEQGRYLVSLKPKAEEAAEQDAADIARTMSAAARQASDAAAAAAAADLDAQLGPGRAAAAQSAAEAQAAPGPAPERPEPEPLPLPPAYLRYEFNPDDVLRDLADGAHGGD